MLRSAKRKAGRHLRVAQTADSTGRDRSSRPVKVAGGRAEGRTMVSTQVVYEPSLGPLTYDDDIRDCTVDEVCAVRVADRVVVLPIQADLARSSGFDVVAIETRLLTAIGVKPRVPGLAPLPASALIGGPAQEATVGAPSPGSTASRPDEISPASETVASPSNDVAAKVDSGGAGEAIAATSLDALTPLAPLAPLSPLSIPNPATTPPGSSLLNPAASLPNPSAPFAKPDGSLVNRAAGALVDGDGVGGAEVDASTDDAGPGSTTSGMGDGEDSGEFSGPENHPLHQESAALIGTLDETKSQPIGEVDRRSPTPWITSLQDTFLDAPGHGHGPDAERTLHLHSRSRSGAGPLADCRPTCRLVCARRRCRTSATPRGRKRQSRRWFVAFTGGLARGRPTSAGDPRCRARCVQSVRQGELHDPIGQPGRRPGRANP